MSQSVTFNDGAGNEAQYTVFDKDHHNAFPWSTDHGDRGVARSFEEARYCARAALKNSMAVNRRSDTAMRMNRYPTRWR